MSDLQIERRKFEEWTKEPGHPEGGYKLAKTVSGAYIDPETRCAWRGWVGRAQLAAPVAAQEDCFVCGDPADDCSCDAAPVAAGSLIAALREHDARACITKPMC